MSLSLVRRGHNWVVKPTKTADTRLAEFICSTCQKPISLKARSDVTRFLSFESRCQCGDSPDDTVPPELVEIPDETETLTLIQSAQKTLGDAYEVLELLRAGLTGDVFKVRDKALDKLFAAKIMHPDLAADINTVKMFQQQARAAQDLTHVNLAAIYQIQLSAGGAPCIIMDYLDGETLGEELARHGFLDVPRALDIFIQTAEALVHAHTKGVTHYDLKPANLVLSKGDGGQDLVKLVDFGIARSLPSADAGGTTTSGKRSSGHPTKPVAGSPRHMSPEQCLSRPLDARSDIYSFGCIMYEALTNVPVFEDKNPIRVMVKQVGTKPRHFAELKYEYQIPPDLEQIVFRCLEKSPSGRYQSAQALLDDLRRVQAGQPLSPPSQPVAGRILSLNPLLAGVVALVMLFTLTMGLLGGAFMMQTHLHNRPRSVAPPLPAVTVSKSANSNFRSGPSAVPAFSSDALNGLSVHDARVLAQWADRYYVQNDYELAAPLLEFVVRAYSEGKLQHDDTEDEKLMMAEKYRRLAGCYIALQQPERSVVHFREAIRLTQETSSPHVASLLYDYSRILEAQGKSKEAHKMIEDYKQNGHLSVIP